MNLTNKYDILSPDGVVQNLTLTELFAQSQKTLLYFYPKDNTPGCSLENKDFTCLKEQFKEVWVELYGVSRDSIDAHRKFIADKFLENPLISDPMLQIHKDIWAYWEKNNYWKIIMWVIRSTYLFDKEWNLLKEWKNVRATWHAQRVLNEILTFE